MARRMVGVLALLMGLAGCEPVTVEAEGPEGPREVRVIASDAALPTPRDAADNFKTVVQRVEPVAEAYCRQRRPLGRCDLAIVVLNDPTLPPNALQTQKNGRPVIAFTVALVASARNQHELAFILGHEAAHHILDHIGRGEQDALRGAILGGILASAAGADAETIEKGQAAGAFAGFRRYAKTYELEADTLGARIALAAGYDPLAGAQFFARIPDPGNAFLGSHPPNAQRIAAVRAVVAATPR